MLLSLLRPRHSLLAGESIAKFGTFGVAVTSQMNVVCVGEDVRVSEYVRRCPPSDYEYNLTPDQSLATRTLFQPWRKVCEPMRGGGLRRLWAIGAFEPRGS